MTKLLYKIAFPLGKKIWNIICIKTCHLRAHGMRLMYIPKIAKAEIGYGDESIKANRSRPLPSPPPSFTKKIGLRYLWLMGFLPYGPEHKHLKILDGRRIRNLERSWWQLHSERMAGRVGDFDASLFWGRWVRGGGGASDEICMDESKDT